MRLCLKQKEKKRRKEKKPSLRVFQENICFNEIPAQFLHKVEAGIYTYSYGLAFNVFLFSFQGFVALETVVILSCTRKMIVKLSKINGAETICGIQ